MMCGFRSWIWRLLERVGRECAEANRDVAKPVKANIYYYGDRGVRPHARKRGSGERDR
jgi:hypothetical protein